MTNISPLFALEAEQYLLAGMTIDALNLCIEGIAAYPDYPSAYIIMANVYVELKEMDKAFEIINYGLSKFPTNKNILNLKKTFIEPELKEQISELKDESETNENLTYDIVEQNNDSTNESIIPIDSDIFALNHETEINAIESEISEILNETVLIDKESIQETNYTEPIISLSPENENINLEPNNSISPESVEEIEYPDYDEPINQNIELTEISLNNPETDNETKGNVNSTENNEISETNGLKQIEDSESSQNLNNTDFEEQIDNFEPNEEIINESHDSIDHFDSDMSNFKRLLLKSDKFDNLKLLRAGNLSLIQGLEFSALKVFSTKPKIREYYSELIDPPPFYEILTYKITSTPEKHSINLKSIADQLKSVTNSNLLDDNVDNNDIWNDFHSTETMAKILIGQKAFEQAYEIYISLAKNEPEKSAYYISKAEELKFKF